MKLAGLSIEGDTAKFSVVSRALGVSKPLKAGEAALPSAEAERSEALKGLLLGLKKDHGISGVAFGLDFREFAHHFLRLPLRSKSDIGGALAFEMEKRLPLPIEEYAYDFRVLLKDKEGSDVLVLSIRKERLRWIGECAKDAGLRLMGVRCSFMEAASEFVSGGKAGGIFLLRSGDYFYMAGLKAGRPGFLKVKSASDIATEIERQQEAYPGGVFASGTLDQYPSGLDAEGVPYSVPNIVANAPFKKATLGFNFTPEEFAPRKKDYYPYAAGLMTAACFALYALTDVVAFYKDYSALRRVEGRIEEIKQNARGIIDTKRGVESAGEKVRLLSGFRAGSGAAIGSLRELSSLLPTDAWLTDFSADRDGKVEIKGLASRASNLIEPIEKSKSFKGVEFSAPVTRKDNAQRFSLKMEIEK